MAETDKSADPENPTVRTYAYYSNSQRLHTISVGGEVEETYTWTANGELSTKTSHAGGGDVVETYYWGLDGTLRGVGFSGGTYDGVEIVYDYDCDGERIARRVYRDGALRTMSATWLIART